LRETDLKDGQGFERQQYVKAARGFREAGDGTLCASERSKGNALYVKGAA
jgi:hypothetical protein